MNVIQRSKHFVKEPPALRFRTRLFLSYLPILFIPVIFLSLRFSAVSQSVIVDQASRNVYEILRKDNEIMDAKLAKIQENSLSLIVDQDLFDTFNDAKLGTQQNVMSMDRRITKTISKYFTQTPEVLSAQIVTSYYTFGANTSMISGDSYTHSSLYHKAVDANGGLVWIPTYDFTRMFGNEPMQTVPDLGNRYVMSAVRLLNCSYIDDWVLTQLPSNIERPVLVVNFAESFFSDNIEDSIPVRGATYLVINADGQTVSASDKALLGAAQQPAWLPEALRRGSGTMTLKVDGTARIVCFDTSRVTGWISAVVIPEAELTRGIASVVNQSFLAIAALFLLVALALSLLFSVQISQPIRRMLAVIQKMEQGKFNYRVTSRSRDEFGFLIGKFNTMNERIEVLIEENYLAKIREKETEIMALNLQLNPHFIYNSLNVINWMAIEAGNDTISNATMDLCTMLELSLRNKKDIIPFEQELSWLRCYLNIMSYRYEGKFTVEYSLEDGLERCPVPKLFLQPFVENAIYHGFAGIEQGGRICIGAHRQQDMAVFTVGDNGVGIDEARIPEILSRERPHIGVQNVDKRIKLLFGDQYGVTLRSEPGEGTLVTITLPCGEANAGETEGKLL